jgi:hypothetical protein
MTTVEVIAAGREHRLIDNKVVAFVRKTAGRMVQTGLGDEEANEIWMIGTTGEPARMLFQGGQVSRNSPVSVTPMYSVPIATLRHPQFSPDGKRIYFWGSQAAVSGAVGVVDLATGEVKNVTGAGNFEVIYSGPFRGCLIVSQHRYFLGGGSYDWFWVVKADGTDVGPLGESAEFCQMFYSCIAPPQLCQGVPPPA